MKNPNNQDQLYFASENSLSLYTFPNEINTENGKSLADEVIRSILNSKNLELT